MHFFQNWLSGLDARLGHGHIDTLSKPPFGIWGPQSGDFQRNLTIDFVRSLYYN